MIRNRMTLRVGGRSRRLAYSSAVVAASLLAAVGFGAGAATAATPVGSAQAIADGNVQLAGYTISNAPGVYYCISPAVSPPTSNNQTVLGNLNLAQIEAANPVPASGVTPNVVAGMSTVIKTYGQNPAAATQDAAVSIAVKAAWNLGYLHHEYWKEGYNGAQNVSAMAKWEIYPYSDISSSAVTLAQEYYNQIESYQAGSGVSSGTVNANGAVNDEDNYKGNVVLTPTVPGGTASFTLTNGVVTSSGSSSWSGVLSGPTTIAVRGVPPINDPNYQISINGTYTVTGTAGFLPELDIVTSPGAQTIAAGGSMGTASASTTFQWEEPTSSSAFFSPAATTQQSSAYYVAGQTVTDEISPTLTPNPDSTTNEWLENSTTGQYLPVVGKATLYYSPTPITQSATVPSSATVVATTQFTAGGTTTNPVGSVIPVSWPALSNDEAAVSGFYTVVVSYVKSDQSPLVQLFWGTDWTSAYGVTTEGATVPPAITTQAQTTTGQSISVNGHTVPATGLGLEVSDNITVTGHVDASSGFYAIDRHYTFTNTVSPNGQPIAPSNPVCSEGNIDYTSPQIPITTTGTIQHAASMDSSVNGVGTWVETLYSPKGVALESTPCNDTSEWTYVAPLLVRTTAATSGSGTAVDHTTVWGTASAGTQLSWALYLESGSTASDSDQLLGTAGPVGIPSGVLNGYQLTSPAVAYTATRGATVYFVETATDVNGNIYEQGPRGVASESLGATTPASSGTQPVATAAQLPTIAG